jgi:hypothetical protein
MPSKKKTLRSVFADPIKNNIDWHEIEALIRQLGGQVTYGSGSSVIFSLNGLRAVFHSPHPQKEASKGRIRELRKFLRDANAL